MWRPADGSTRRYDRRRLPKGYMGNSFGDSVGSASACRTHRPLATPPWAAKITGFVTRPGVIQRSPLASGPARRVELLKGLGRAAKSNAPVNLGRKEALSVGVKARALTVP